MKNIDIQRQSNYELLRMLAGMAVVVLHFNYFPGGIGVLDVARGANYYVLMFFEVLFSCAVNVFILLTGYFSCDSKRIKIGRLIELLLQTMCFKFFWASITCITNHCLDVKMLLGSLIPANYFVILYTVLLILAPFINKLISVLKLENLIRLTLISFFVFSIFATAVDILKEITGNPWTGLSTVALDGSGNGYTIVNFILVYIIGVWLRKTNCAEKCKTSFLLISLAGIVIAIFSWRHILPATAWTYCNPLLITEACIVFVLFGRIKLKSRIVNALAPASFSCFLIQNDILRQIDLRSIAQRELIYMLSRLVIIVIGIYTVSYIITVCWKMVYRNTIGKVVGKIPEIVIE